MSEVNIDAFTQNDIKALEKRSIAQPHRPATYAVLATWSLAAAFGVAFWTLLLYYGIPIIANLAEITEGAVKVKHLVDRSPSTVAAEW
jgi:hypothetical protein